METEQSVKLLKTGTKEQVWNGQAVMTRGKLIKDDLTLSSKGKVCSKKSVEKGKELQARMRERYMREQVKAETEPETAPTPEPQQSKIEREPVVVAEVPVKKVRKTRARKIKVVEEIKA